MRLEELIHGVEVRARAGETAPLRGLAYDSRQVQPGWCFAAIKGEVADGNRFLGEAMRRGATAVVSEEPPPAGWAGAAWVQVKAARVALAQMAANWFAHPARRLALVGITGTNGKTTTSLLTEALLRGAGRMTGLLGTIEYHIGDEVLDAPHTTPESYELQRLLARMAEAGCEAAVMEVSSHALAMERVWGCRFEAAVFTNLTQDHLDFHGTLANYRAAKRRLFEGVGAPPPAFAAVNADDPASREMLRGFNGEALSYGFDDKAELRAAQMEQTPAGIRFRLHGPEGWRAAVTLPLLGRINARNALAALAVGLHFDLDRETMLHTLARFERVRGRFERVYAGQPFTVAVDYAHTPDALLNLAAIAREVAGAGRVLLVFGCGGDRDRSKRPLMGEIAARRADWVAVTSDNPRSEEPLAVINDVMVGAQKGGGAVIAEPDRRQAIARALAEARPGDLVAIAGKGHETVQIMGAQRLPFDDAAVARELLRGMGWNS